MKRWVVVVLAAALLVVVPVAVRHRPGGAGPVAPSNELIAKIQASGAVGWSGRAQSQGSLQLPASTSFATLGQLLGERIEMRAWWRGDTSWRVDRIRSTGETDTFRAGGGQVRWIFESERATYSPVSTIRLPDAVDVLPPTLGRDLFQGAQVDELSAIAGRRVAGVDALGLRLTPSGSASTVDHVDLWADPGTGLPLQVDLYGKGVASPVLSTALTDVSLVMPDPSDVRFRAPAGVTLAYEESTDVAAEANALQRFELPPTLAGLSTRSGDEAGAVGVYGRGPTTMMVLPLRGSVARPLRDQLSKSATANQTTDGVAAPVGPISVLLTPFRQGRGSFLLAGTVTPETLETAAAQLGGRA